MNWYSFIKIAQIWSVRWDDSDFESMLLAFHELEYKLSMAKTKQFSGTPRRQENIVQQLKKEFLLVAESIREILVNVFNNWLNSHALLSPQTWARGRLSQNENFEFFQDTGKGFEDILESILYDYAEHKNISLVNYGYRTGMSTDQLLSQIIRNEIAPNIDKFPQFKAIAESFLVGYKEMLYDDLTSEGFEEFSKRMNENFTDEQQARTWIDNITIDTIDISDYIYSIRELESAISATGNSTAILQELSANLVFPLWYAKWYEQGIKETRASIARIWEQLNYTGADNVSELSTAISLALNASHQTGSMLDYVESWTGSENLKTILDTIHTQGTGEWDKELAKIGFK